jgi:predicted nucleotidyltransferase
VSLSASIVASLRRIGEQHPEVDALYVFGSRASGEHRPDSDLGMVHFYQTTSSSPSSRASSVISRTSSRS